MALADNVTVLVTGASGYIATHVVQQLQRAGYRVRGTVRSLVNEEKVKPLKNLCPDAKHELELFEADLTSDAGWEQAVRGCDFVMHTASPFPNENPAHEDELIKPAVEGTLTVLRACAKVGGVRRVVVTSSVAAVSNGFDIGGEFSEVNWTDTTGKCMPYIKSKTLAERAAWDFVDKLPNQQKFELTTVNPCYVMGPILCGGYATSMELPKRLLERQMPLLPRLNFPVVDVRDVAAAHVTAMVAPDAAAKRHILASHNLWMKDAAVILRKEFHPLGYNVPTGEAPYCMVKILSLCDATIRLILPSWDKVTTYDNTRMRTVLKITPRSAEESLSDMCHSMIERGFIKKTEKYKKIRNNPA